MNPQQVDVLVGDVGSGGGPLGQRVHQLRQPFAPVRGDPQLPIEILGSALEQIAMAHMTAPPPKPSIHRRGIPIAINDVIATASPSTASPLTLLPARHLRPTRR